MEAYKYKSMEQFLIEEVRKRPEIYDKSIAAYRNLKMREHAWYEVARAINVADVELVKKRWGTLRDSFIKIQRAVKHNPGQRVKWLYYKQFLFLIPHVASKVHRLLEEAAKHESDEAPDASPSTPSSLEADAGGIHPYVAEEVADDPLQRRRKKKRLLEEDPLAVDFHQKKNRSVCDEDSFSGKEVVDADEQFLLSCLPTLKRLNQRDNALARIKIQQVLFDVEFGGDEQNDGVLVMKVEVDDD